MFDRKEATFTEKQCLEWVKTMAPHPEPEPPPEVGDDLDEDSDDTFATRKLRKLFAHGTRQRTGPSKPR